MPHTLSMVDTGGINRVNPLLKYGHYQLLLWIAPNPGHWMTGFFFAYLSALQPVDTSL
jgi:hypothetical protein